MLFTWKAVFDAFVSNLLDYKTSDASFAELLYLRERPWRKALTLGSVTESWTRALCSVSQALISARVLSSVLQRHIPDCAATELGGWAQLMNVSGDGTWWVPVRWVRIEEFFAQILTLFLLLTCQCNYFGDCAFDFPLYFSVSTQARALQLLRVLYSTMAYFKDDSIVNCSRGAIWLLGWLL